MPALENFIASFAPLADYARPIAAGAAMFAVLFLALIANVVMRKVIVVIVRRFLNHTKSKRDDILIRRGVFERLSQLAPALVIYQATPRALEHYPVIAGVILKFAIVYMVAVGVLFLDGVINAAVDLLRTYRASRHFPLKSFAQVAKLVTYFIAFIITLSVLLGKSPATFIAGLGALAAVLTFVFKDLILGLVAGIQLSANRMVAVGDWIEMPSQGVDGDVMEIALTTVKIRNFDKTITTVPTQSLIYESFKNWRGMTETGGRRIKRAVLIDVGSIRFCDAAMLERLSKIDCLADYLETKKRELAEYNGRLGGDVSMLANGRRLTNIGTFRAYIEVYLRRHPKIAQHLTLLVRQLPATEHGLPIEVYAFANDTNWVNYEGLQADIFDHIFAVAPEFGLRIFQDPTGGDLAAIAAAERERADAPA